MKELNLNTLGKILIIAPHPDDAVIGLGGLIYTAVSKKIPITVYYITDGAGSKGDIKNIIQLRKQETIEALQVIDPNLDLIQYKFWDFTSKEVKENNNILKTIDINASDTIFLPHYTDIHPTHHSITEFFMHHTSTKKIIFYEVWGNVIKNKEVYYLDISDIIGIKKTAILKHHTQNKILSFADGIIAKNKYNAVFKDINTYSISRFIELYEEYTEC